MSVKTTTDTSMLNRKKILLIENVSYLDRTELYLHMCIYLDALICSLFITRNYIS